VEVDGIETEEEQRAALNKLLQVKKYFLNRMVLQDLEVIGRDILGPDLKATRLKKWEEQLKQIAQVHEAIAYFQIEVQKWQQRLQALAANDENTVTTVCSWEIEYVNILPVD
jgi:hypothetical protein